MNHYCTYIPADQQDTSGGWPLLIFHHLHSSVAMGGEFQTEQGNACFALTAASSLVSRRQGPLPPSPIVDTCILDFPLDVPLLFQCCKLVTMLLLQLRSLNLPSRLYRCSWSSCRCTLELLTHHCLNGAVCELIHIVAAGHCQNMDVGYAIFDDSCINLRTPVAATANFPVLRSGMCERILN